MKKLVFDKSTRRIVAVSPFIDPDEVDSNIYEVLDVSDDFVFKPYYYIDDSNQIAEDIQLKNEYLNRIKNRAKQIVKETTKRKILKFAPDYHQRNYAFRWAELNEKVLNGGTLTQEEQTELDNIKNIWARINAIRSASDQIEAEIDALTDEQAIENYDIENNPLWPE